MIKEMDKPVISVLMLAYNHEKFAAEAINSVLAQNCTETIEIVIGEDYSTDSTMSILQDLQASHPDKIQILRRDKNVGMMRNFVETYNACRGDFIALLECDDFWTDTNKLQKQFDHMQLNQTDSVVFHNVRKLETMNGSEETVLVKEKPFQVKTIADMWSNGPFFTCSAFIRRASQPVLEESFLSMPIADWPLFIMLAERGSFGFIDEPMSTYRVHAGGVWSSSNSISKLECDIKVLRQLDKHFSYKYSREIRKEIAKRHCWMGHCYIDDGQRAAAGKQAIKALKTDPRITKNTQQVKLMVKCVAPRGVTKVIKKSLQQR